MEAVAALTRRQISDTLLQISTVADALQRLPYKDAVEPLMAVHEMQATLYQTLPGGFAGICVECKIAVGNDETHDRMFGDVICARCADAGHDLPTVSRTRESEPA
ncbi:hypothetical protein [Pelagibacterium lentulum]|uniref:DksA C4-type domain-containing protein n=1 Tax=Pelagibacterium lentulum TaxID=2029865 RepID=A0A916RPY3_9HYPH|nr:hypothetical protein [Pelagibacterium lentulum]GGA64718.1 hypothetical protein GCM10011499_38980 [Pelagibacterium lentulum]